MILFYNENNSFMRQHLRPDTYYVRMIDLLLRESGITPKSNGNISIEDALKHYWFVAETMENFTTQDPAFKHMYNQLRNLLKLCTCLHMADESQRNKELALVITAGTDVNKAIEVADTYGYGYTVYKPYVNSNTCIAIDLRGKDFDSGQFLEFMEFIKESFPLTKRSVEYAGCFFR